MNMMQSRKTSAAIMLLFILMFCSMNCGADDLESLIRQKVMEEVQKNAPAVMRQEIERQVREEVQRRFRLILERRRGQIDRLIREQTEIQVQNAFPGLGRPTAGENNVRHKRPEFKPSPPPEGWHEYHVRNGGLHRSGSCSRRVFR